MSRRSVLLATTIYIAVGSLMAVGPASAHGFGFGGFGGGGSFAFRSPAVAYIARAPMGNFGGGRFDHAPSISSPVVESSSAGARLQPSRIPAVANAPVGNSLAAASSVRPAQLPSTNTSSGNGVLRPSVDAAGIVRPGTTGIVPSPLEARNAASQQSGVGVGLPARISEIAAAEGRGKLQKPGSDNNVPDTVGNPGVPGHGTANEHGPNVDGINDANGPTINLPGTVFGQKGPRAVPGFDTATGGASKVNLPGSVDPHGPDAANAAIAKMENAGLQLLGSVAKGGPGSQNIPTSSGPEVTAADDDNGKTNAGAAGQSVGSAANVASAAGRAAGSAGLGAGLGGGSIYVAPGLAGSNGSGPTTDGGTMSVNTMQEGKTTYQVTSTTAKDGSTTVTYSELKNGKVTNTTSGPSLPGKNRNTPSDNDSSSIGPLSANSSIAKAGNGGGTDNNGTESSGIQSGELANNSSLSRKGNGDGTGNDGGDNNHVGNDGTLAAGTSLARKNYGDGGGSDTRDGGTSLGSPRVPGGGNPGQSNLNAAAAMGD